MRGDGTRPRGLRAQQTTSHAAGGTPRSVAPNHGRRAIEKGKKSKQKPTFSSADAITAGGSPKIIRRANQEVVRHRTHHQNIQNNPTSKKTSNRSPTLARPTKQDKPGSRTATQLNSKSHYSDSYRAQRVARTTRKGADGTWILEVGFIGSGPSPPPQHWTSKGAKSRSI